MVVYNVGDMKRRGSPAIKHGSSGSVTETGAQQGKSSSTATIRRTEGNGQEKSSGRARDTAARRRMSAEERKNTPPMLGDADTVFADGNTMAAYAEANGNIRRNNIEYADNAARNAAQKALHDRMVNEGKILDLTENRENVSQYFPDLRSMPKAERKVILREKIKLLKDDLRTYLRQIKGASFEFEINGETIEAKLYNAGIQEVLKNLTQEKSGMLFASEEIFKNAEYLYSTTDKRGNPEVSGWDYFYVPVKLGDDTAGVRIAVRNMIQPNEAQIYNWGIKKEDAPLGGGGPLPFGSASTGASSDASSNEMSSGPVADTQGANIDSNAIASSETNIHSTAWNSQENSSGRASVEVKNRNTEMSEEDARRDFSPAGEPPRVDLAADSFCSITHALMPQKLRLRRNRSAFFCPRQRQTAFPSVQIPSRKAYTKKDSLPHRAGNPFWYARRDLNPRPLAPEANTLSS